MNLLVLAPLTFNTTMPLGITTLKSFNPSKIKCVDLGIKYNNIIGKIYDKKYKKLYGKVNLKLYMMLKSIHYSFHGKDTILADYIAINYPMFLLEKIEDDIDIEFLEIIEKMVNEITDENLESIGFSTTQQNLGISLLIAKNMKKKYPNIKIILGGCGVLTYAKYLKEFDFIDNIIVGEGEISYKKLLEGKIYDKIIFGEQIDMNNIPIPDYSDLNYNDYERVGLETQRGCINSCVFCTNRVYPGNAIYKEKSIKNIINELEYLKKFDKKICFCDNISNANKERLVELCKEIIRKKLNITWSAEMVANIDLKTAKLLKEAGCTHISLGIESFNDKVLKLMNKPVRKKDILKTLYNLNEADIKVVGMFIIGFPGETVFDMLYTYYILLKNINLFYLVYLNHFHMRYGSKISKTNKNIIKIDDKWSSFNDAIPFKSDFFINTIKYEITKFIEDVLLKLEKTYIVNRW